jgi:adenylosuccinate lyase
VDYMLSKMTALVSQMRVFPQRMLRNLESTHGLVYSGQLLLDLVEKGMPRDDAYKTVQENATAAWEAETSFRERVEKDGRITKYLSPKELENTFDLKRQLRHVDKLFDRVFGAHPAGERGAAAV